MVERIDPISCARMGYFLNSREFIEDYEANISFSDRGKVNQCLGCNVEHLGVG